MISFWYWVFGIFGTIALLIFILGFPRKKNERTPSLEGLDDPDVAKAFERMANFFPFKILRRQVISQLKKLNVTGRVVDMGCGTGHLIVQIAKEFSSLELIGVDISSVVLEMAKIRTENEGLSEIIEFKLGNAENMPFLDNSVDILVSTLSLHHWLDPIQVISEIKRVLKQNGMFLIFDFRRDARKFFYGLLTFITKIVVPKPLKKVNEPIGSLKAGYTPEEAFELFSQVTFDDLEIKPYLAWMFIKGKK